MTDMPASSASGAQPPRGLLLDAAIVCQFHGAGAVAERRDGHLSQFILPDAARRAVDAGVPSLIPSDLHAEDVLRA